MDGTIETHGLAKSFGANRVLDDLTLRIDGGVFALLGRNGAGKTTLVSILTTLIRADAGTARVAGHDVARDRRRLRAAISTTGQFAAIDELLTGRENLVLFGRLRGLPAAVARRRAAELLDQFGLADAAGRAANTYSGGMKRRLDLAASMITRPAVLFLDEPTTGLDLESRQQVWRDVLALAADGTTIFLTTQYLEEAEALADRIAILDGGRIVADGTASRLKAIVGGESLALVLPTGEVLHEAPTDGTPDAVAAALSELPPHDPAARLELRQPTLDDVFLALTARQRADRPADRPEMITGGAR
ncbi:ATP-binding cassette domain-containing protein [Naumannella huperziae]